MAKQKNTKHKIPPPNSNAGKYELLTGNLAVVLVGTQGERNLGAAARAMANFGFTRLRLVAPRVEILSSDARAMSMDAVTILESAEVFGSLAEAVADCQLIVGTTRRVGSKRRAELSPPAMAETLIGLPPGHRAAIVFGPEDKGLTSEDVHHCNAVVSIRTKGDFNSFNLAQAVLLLLYEIHRSCEDAAPARVAELERAEKLVEHAESLLRLIGFIKGPDGKQTVARLRKLALRAAPGWRETRMLHAILGHLESALGAKDGEEL